MTDTLPMTVWLADELRAVTIDRPWNGEDPSQMMQALLHDSLTLDDHAGLPRSLNPLTTIRPDHVTIGSVLPDCAQWARFDRDGLQFGCPDPRPEHLR